MIQDIALTATGTPAIVAGDTRYPLAWTIAGIKEWAEYKKSTFEDLIKGNWEPNDLTMLDWVTMLKITLKGGEARRALFDGEPRVITDELVERLFNLLNPVEMVAILVAIWNEPPSGSAASPKESQ